MGKVGKRKRCSAWAIKSIGCEKLRSDIPGTLRKSHRFGFIDRHKSQMSSPRPAVLPRTPVTVTASLAANS